MLDIKIKKIGFSINGIFVFNKNIRNQSPKEWGVICNKFGVQFIPLFFYSEQSLANLGHIIPSSKTNFHQI